VVEPFARDRLSDNLNPVGGVYFSASTLVCTAMLACRRRVSHAAVPRVLD
jgi:hypothetical protein